MNMFREMRRSTQSLSNDEINAILENYSSGVLALSGDNDYPYAVPLSYAYNGDKIYFHCAKAGHKLDAVKNNDKASFCVISQDEIHEEEFVTYYKSVIAFGKIKIVDDKNEIIDALHLITDKYSPSVSKEMCNEEITKFLSAVCILRLDIEHSTGKQAKALIKK